MIKVIFTSSVSACIEWLNNNPYYAEKSYSVLLNGNKVTESNLNVFSLFDLTPDTHYVVEIEGRADKVEFDTDSETCCVNVADFGAVGDGVTNDTRAVQSAIDCLPRGARLYFPQGNYLVAPLTLKSDITLHLSKDACILGSIDRQDYPVIPGNVTDVVTGKPVQTGCWEGNSVPMYKSLIFGEYLTNVKIVGQGIIDGNAHNSTWWVNVKEIPYGRPRLLYFNGCNNVNVHGVTVQNSPSWQIHPYFCKSVGIYGVTVNAPFDSPNTDAIDPEACDGVDIIGCTFSVGDDCIAIKSCKIELGKLYKQPANNHTIRNCLMQFGHGAVTLGSEMAGGVTNLTVNRCVFNSTDRGLRIKTRRGRGKYAIIDGVTFENIVMNDVRCPIVINMWYNCCDPDRFSEYVWSREKLPVDDRTPHLGKFCFVNIKCNDCHYACCYCDGLPESPIDEITVENVSFTVAHNARSGYPAMRNHNVEMSKAGLYFDNVSNLVIKNVTTSGVVGDEIIVNNVGKLTRE